MAIVAESEHLLPREPRALGAALGEALVADGVALHLARPALGRPLRGR